MRLLSFTLVILAFTLLSNQVSATDLTVRKEAEDSIVAVGDTVRFTITVDNTSTFGGGPLDSGVNLFERFTPGLEWLSIEGGINTSQCQTIAAGDGFDCMFDIQAGQVIVATAIFIAREIGDQVNGVSVSPTIGDPDPNNNEAQAIVTVEGIEITKTGGSNILDDAPDFESDFYFYVITVKSFFSTRVEGLDVEDVFPNDLNIIDWGLSFNELDCQLGTLIRELDCPVFSLNPGETKKVSVVLNNRPSQFGEICNTAVLKKDGEEIGSSTHCAQVRRRYRSTESIIEDLELLVEEECQSSAAPCTAPTQSLTADLVETETEICEADGSNCYATGEQSWISYRNYEYHANYSKMWRVDVVPASSTTDDNGEIMTMTGTGLAPIIRVMNEDGSSVETNLSELEEFSDAQPEANDFPTFDIGNDPPATPRVCAVLVSGFSQNEKEATGFMVTRDVMQRHLTNGKFGPQIPADNITVLTNPTREQFKQTMAGLKGNCDKLVFYYYGHGNKDGIFLKGSSRFDLVSYADVAKEIYGVEAKENQVILDNCNSGAAIPAFKADAGFKKADTSVFTAASAEKLGYQAFKTLQPGILVSFFTGLMVACSNDLRADANKDDVLTFGEAFKWLRTVDPKLLKFRNRNGGVDSFGINEKQDPQMIESKVQTNDGTKTSFDFEDSGVKVTLGNGFANQGIASIRVEEVSPRGGNLENNGDLFELSDRRYRSVEIIEDDNPSGYSVDISFKMDASLDSLMMDGLPGLASRSDDNANWSPVDPSYWFAVDSSVRVYGVTSTSDWTIGLTRGAVVDIEDEVGLPESYVLHDNYPNPFNPSTTISYELPSASVVSLTVFDMTGRPVATLLSDVSKSPGEYSVVWDGTNDQGITVASGFYLYALRAGDYVDTRKMLLVK